jgi:uncharacterized protein YdgA (DUF945 family)
MRYGNRGFIIRSFAGNHRAIMKKIWITLVVIVVLIAAWMSVAWYIGTRIEVQTSDIIAHINANLASNQRTMGAQIQQISYQRGLFSSHARFAVTSRLLGNQPLSETDLTFSHGPFPLAALQHGNFLPQKYQAHIELLPTAGPLKMIAGALMGGKPPLVMDVDCDYNHHCDGIGSVPPINADLGPLSQNAKLAFGGVQMRFDFDRQSDTDYKAGGNAQLLPLSIGGQNFGSGRFMVTSDARSVNEAFSWQTDQGASKLTVALTATRPMPLWGDPAFTSEDLPKLIKTASARLELSKSMIVDLAARALNLTKGVDLATTRQQMSTQLDATLASNPQASKFIQTQGDLLLSDWQYADGKLTVNGQEQPELLEQIKQSYQARLQAEEQAAANAAVPTPGTAAAPPASDPSQAASGQ